MATADRAAIANSADSAGGVKIPALVIVLMIVLASLIVPVLMMASMIAVL